METTKTYTKNENGFYTNYTTEDTLREMKEYKDSNTCSMTNPEFYSLWEWDNPNQEETEETKAYYHEKWLKERELMKTHL